MKIVFFGTPDYVLPVLDSLHKEFRGRPGDSPIVAVVTQSPKPVGRTKKLSYSAVDTWAHKKKIPVYFDSTELIKEEVQADVGIVAAYGAIIPQEVLEYFPFGLLNLHFSLLPEFRGASPVHASIITGQKEMGITIFKLDPALDHGQIVSQFKVGIDEDDTVETLRDKGFTRSAEILKTLLPAYIQGKITLKEQDHSQATYSRVIKKEDGFIPLYILQLALQGEILQDQTWEIPFIYTKNNEGQKIPYHLPPTADNLSRFIKALSPWPGAWSQIEVRGQRLEVSKKKRLKILKAHVEKLSSNTLYLIPDIVQLEGKNPVPWKQFKTAYPQFAFSMDGSSL